MFCTQCGAKIGNDAEFCSSCGFKLQGSPYYGVKGWLKFFVIVNMYISPVIFVLRYIFAWVGFVILAEDYPGIIPIGLIETVVGGFLVYKFIQIARHLRDIRPGAVQEAKKWIFITFIWVLVDMPLLYFTGLNAEDLIPGAIKAFLGGLIGFAIWYSYFNVSKRVKATYPDWDK